MLPISYGNAHIRSTLPNEIFAKDIGTQLISILNCPDKENEKEEDTDVKYCYLNKEHSLSTCLGHLLHGEIDNSILNCKFEIKTTNTVTPLRNHALLIQGTENLQIIAGGKAVFHMLPIVLRSTKTITITGTEEMIFPSNYINETDLLLTTKLTKLQITGVYLKAEWDTFVDNLDITIYINWITLEIQLLFTPVELVSLILGCKNKRKIIINKKKLESKIRKGNYQENKLLLKGEKKPKGK